MKDYSRCPKCKKEYTAEEQFAKRLKKSASMDLARAKVLAEGRIWGRKATPIDVERVVALSQAGGTLRGIAKEMGVSRNKIFNTLKKYRAGLKT